MYSCNCELIIIFLYYIIFIYLQYFSLYRIIPLIEIPRNRLLKNSPYSGESLLLYSRSILIIIFIISIFFNLSVNHTIIIFFLFRSCSVSRSTFSTWLCVDSLTDFHHNIVERLSSCFEFFFRSISFCENLFEFFYFFFCLCLIFILYFVSIISKSLFSLMNRSIS